MYNKTLKFFVRDHQQITSNFKRRYNNINAICEKFENYLKMIQKIDTIELLYTREAQFKSENPCIDIKNALDYIEHVKNLLTVIKAKKLLGQSILDERKYAYVLTATELLLSGRLSKEQYIKAAKNFPGAAYNIYISAFLTTLGIACFITGIAFAYLLTGTTMLEAVLGCFFAAAIICRIGLYLHKETGLANLVSPIILETNNTQLITEKFCSKVIGGKYAGLYSDDGEKEYEESFIKSFK